MTDYRAWYDEIREQHRVLWHPDTDSWYIGRFDDVWDMLVSSHLGARSPDTFTKKMTPPQQALCSRMVDFVARWPVFSDVPRHNDIHRLILPAFSQAESRRVADSVRHHIGRSPGEAWSEGDALEAVVRPACSAALADFLGIDHAGLAQVSDWSQRIIAFVGQTAFNEHIMRAADAALAQFTDFVTSACRTGQSVLTGQLRTALADGSIDERDAVAIYGQMVTGFLQPTISSLAAAIEVLTAGPEFREHFAADPDAFISESIRLASPFHFAPRRAQQDIEIDGHRIPASERVVLLLVAANRDPRRFQAPLTFRMDRGRSPHVAFARGRYACLGAAMARQMMGAVLSAIAEAPPYLIPPLTVSWQVGRGMRMPARLTPGRAGVAV